MIKKNIIFSLFILVFFLFQIISLISLKRELNREMLVMGTVCRISIITDKDSNTNRAEDILNKAFALLKDYERRWSFYSEDSEIALINAQAVDMPVGLLPDTFEIIKKSLELSQITNGVFDITATSLHQQGGYGNIILDGKSRSVMFNNKETKIDLGGIATGYAIDKVVDLFKKNKINNYLIDVGGDIYASGKNQKNKSWEIGVRSPLDEDIILYDFSLDDQAVTTSGNYVKKHIIDPKTRNLADSNIESVTVIADNCLQADALATAFFVFGIEKTKAFVDSFDNSLQVLFIKKSDDSPEIVKYNWKKD